MPIKWSDFALQSLEEIIHWYEVQAGKTVADSVADRIFMQVEKMETFPTSVPVSDVVPQARKVVIRNLPYVAFIRPVEADDWEVIDVVHTSRKLPKNA